MANVVFRDNVQDESLLGRLAVASRAAVGASDRRTTLLSGGAGAAILAVHVAGLFPIKSYPRSAAAAAGTWALAWAALGRDVRLATAVTAGGSILAGTAILVLGMIGGGGVGSATDTAVRLLNRLNQRRWGGFGLLYVGVALGTAVLAFTSLHRRDPAAITCRTLTGKWSTLTPGQFEEDKRSPDLTFTPDRERGRYKVTGDDGTAFAAQVTHVTRGVLVGLEGRYDRLETTGDGQLSLLGPEGRLDYVRADQ